MSTDMNAANAVEHVLQQAPTVWELGAWSVRHSDEVLSMKCYLSETMAAATYIQKPSGW